MPLEPAPSLQFGDVVLVRFPFTSQIGFKQRPAVVISSSRYNSERPDVILMGITSQLDTALSVGNFTVQQWKEAGLIKPSAIKPVIATIEQALIVRRLGNLQQLDVLALRASIAAIIS
jgi:mRNA interferase MazF